MLARISWKYCCVGSRGGCWDSKLQIPRWLWADNPFWGTLTMSGQSEAQSVKPLPKVSSPIYVTNACMTLRMSLMSCLNHPPWASALAYWSYIVANIMTGCWWWLACKCRLIRSGILMLTGETSLLQCDKTSTSGWAWINSAGNIPAAKLHRMGYRISKYNFVQCYLGHLWALFACMCNPDIQVHDHVHRGKSFMLLRLKACH